MLNRLPHSESSRGRADSTPHPPQPVSKHRSSVRRATPGPEFNSAHWKQMVEAEARHRLKRALGALRK